MRFSEIAVTNLESPEVEQPTPDDVGGVAEIGENHRSEKGSGDSKKRKAAASLIQSIGIEFSRLRKIGRSGAWADLEDKVAKSGHLLTDSGMMTVKDWTGILIDIEQFRKSEGGTSESPGDALARWLSEGEKPKKVKKVQ